MAYREKDEKLIAKNLKRLREERGLNKTEFADRLGFDRTYYGRWESGERIPSKEHIDIIANAFGISAEELYKNISVAIVHTSALMINKRILAYLLEDYESVIIPGIVMQDIEDIKSGRKEYRDKRAKKYAWEVMMAVSRYQVANRNNLLIMDTDDFTGDSVKIILALAEKIKKDHYGDVFIIHDDISLTLGYKDNLRVKEYLANRKENIGYHCFLQLKEEWDDFDEINVDGVNLNTYLPNGMTLLIDCIRCNTKDRIDDRKGERIPDSRIIQKIQFLLDHGADINLTDRWLHCLTPLAHCVQVDNIELFDYLVEKGADYNYGSKDTLNTTNFLMQNEGNTPLMIACYEGKKKFVNRFIELPDVSFNQQDANGYTALIKAAIGRNNARNKGEEKKIQRYEYIYEKLKSMNEVDKKIRDRKNKTAGDYWDI